MKKIHIIISIILLFLLLIFTNDHLAIKKHEFEIKKRLIELSLSAMNNSNVTISANSVEERKIKNLDEFLNISIAEQYANEVYEKNIKLVDCVFFSVSKMHPPHRFRPIYISILGRLFTISKQNLDRCFDYDEIEKIKFRKTGELPEDLEKKKIKLNDRKRQLYDEAEEVTEKNLDDLVNNLIDLKNDIISYTDECNNRGFTKNNEKVLKEIEDKISLVKTKVKEQPTSITFAQAESFMRVRCEDIGQTLMRSKSTFFNNTKIYMFLSVAENGDVCISSISEYALEVLAADCGPLDVKMEQWNAL